MQNVFEQVVTAAVNTGWSVVNPGIPRFPRASLWAGKIADGAMSFSAWIGLQVPSPFRAAWLWLSFRAARVRWSQRPFGERLLIGAGACLASALALGFERFLANHQKQTK